MIKKFIEKRADITIEKNLFLAICIQYNWFVGIDYYKSFNIENNFIEKFRLFSPLDYAVFIKNTESVQYLIKLGFIEQFNENKHFIKFSNETIKALIEKL